MEKFENFQKRPKLVENAQKCEKKLKKVVGGPCGGPKTLLREISDFRPPKGLWAVQGKDLAVFADFAHFRVFHVFSHIYTSKNA